MAGWLSKKRERIEDHESRIKERESRSLGIICSAGRNTDTRCWAGEKSQLDRSDGKMSLQRCLGALSEALQLPCC
jgi:hypothetical protein